MARRGGDSPPHGALGAGCLWRTHPDGIDVLVDVASQAEGFSDLSSLVRPGGTALTTRYVADTDASRENTGVNFRMSMSSGLLDRLADAVVNGHTDGKVVIAF